MSETEVLIAVMLEQLFPLLLLVLPGLFVWVIHAYVKSPTGAALGTWLMLTILGVGLTFGSFILFIGAGHGGPAPGGLPLLVGIATLILPFVGAFKVMEAKKNQGSINGEEVAEPQPPPHESLPAPDDGPKGGTVRHEEKVE